MTTFHVSRALLTPSTAVVARRCLSTVSPRSAPNNMTQEPQAAPATAPDWSAAQYLKFGDERTRAVRDLVANIPLQSPRRIIDLGCGPGNSTAVLAARWPSAAIHGVDSSPDMLREARSTHGGNAITFEQADLRTYQPPPPPGAAADLLFSNAVLHWLRRGERVPTVLRLLRTQPPGGVFAFQVPDNRDEPSHRAMRETAFRRPGAPWARYFVDGAAERPDLDPVETPAEWYDALVPLCGRVDVWHVLYQHVLAGPGAIVEWVRATGLMPFLNALPPDGEVRAAFLRAYEERLGEVYPRLADGKVMLRYPRLFVVATKK